MTTSTLPPWQTVPMPKDVAKLPRTSSGMPIVYITDYETDVDDSGLVDSTSSINPMIGCNCEFGVGRPKIGKQCPTRQRKAVAERRCSVCGRRTAPNSELVFLGVGTTEVPGYDGEPYFSIEAGAHPLCAAYAALTCPRMYANMSRVEVAITRRYEWRARVIADFERYRGALVPLDQLGGFPGVIDLYVAIPDPGQTEIVPLDEWMATRAPTRYRLGTTGQEGARR